MRSRRLAWPEGKLLHGVLLWVAHVGAPGSHRHSEHLRRAQLLICWGWLAGKVLASDRRWDGVSVRAVRTWKDLQINSSPTEQVWCSAAAVLVTEGDTCGWCHSTLSTQAPLNRILGGKDHDVMLLGPLLRKWFVKTEVGGARSCCH